MQYFYNQLFLSCFNFANVGIDAYRIMKHKTIAHSINLTAYLIFSVLVYYHTNNNLSSFISWDFCVYILSSFFNRQLTFDIPLNIRRGLEWYYVSKDNPPKALMDRVEIFIFGRNGKTPVYVYSACWLICSIIKIFFLWQH